MATTSQQTIGAVSSVGIDIGKDVFHLVGFEAIAEAALRPNLKVVREKTQDQLDLQALHRVRARLVSRRTATINQIRTFLIEQGITVRAGARSLRNSLFAILKNRVCDPQEQGGRDFTAHGDDHHRPLRGLAMARRARRGRNG